MDRFINSHGNEEKYEKLNDEVLNTVMEGYSNHFNKDVEIINAINRNTVALNSIASELRKLNENMKTK